MAAQGRPQLGEHPGFSPACPPEGREPQRSGSSSCTLAALLDRDASRMPRPEGSTVFLRWRQIALRSWGVRQLHTALPTAELSAASSRKSATGSFGGATMRRRVGITRSYCSPQSNARIVSRDALAHCQPYCKSASTFRMRCNSNNSMLCSRSVVTSAEAEGSTVVDRWAFDQLNVPPDQRIFANNELNLESIQSWGFDFDYTLANYKPALSGLIYDLAKQLLVVKQRYPLELLHKEYDPSFAIRGLHFDKRTGAIIQLDYFRNIATPQVDTLWRSKLKVGDEPPTSNPPSNYALVEETFAHGYCDPDRLTGSAHFGRRRLKTREVESIYGTLRLPEDYISRHLYPLYDLFSMPTACLIADAIQTLSDRGEVPFPEEVGLGMPVNAGEVVDSHVAGDVIPPHLTPTVAARIGQQVIEAVQEINRNGTLQQHLQRDIGAYLAPSPETPSVLRRLREAGRKVFLLTNASYAFVDIGMRQLVRGSDMLPSAWPSLFDVIVCEADKPNFFSSAAPAAFARKTELIAAKHGGSPMKDLHDHLDGNSIVDWDLEEDDWITEEQRLPEHTEHSNLAQFSDLDISVVNTEPRGVTTVCAGGSIGALLAMDEWSPAPRPGAGSQTRREHTGVLYFGDHFAADMKEPSMQHGWRTGMLVPELTEEMERQHCPEYIDAMRRLVSVRTVLSPSLCFPSMFSIDAVPTLVRKKCSVDTY
eukprot:SAG31_NODE_1619_length_7729_cov_2.231193_4_plen_706_part_00